MVVSPLHGYDKHQKGRERDVDVNDNGESMQEWVGRVQCCGHVTFELNARLDLSGQATTKSLCPL